MTELKNQSRATPGKAMSSTSSTAPTQQRDLDLPHERDQQDDQVNPIPDPIIEQAKNDLDAGLVDTDMRATPGLDTQRRKELAGDTPGKKKTD